MRIFFGARGADMGADGVGVTTGTFDAEQLTVDGVAVEAPSPSWLDVHPTLDVVYATLEKAGRVGAFRRHGADLEPLGETVPAGEAVCHLAVSPDGSCLVASCWGDGRVVFVPLADDGSLGDPVLAPAASDPHASGDPTRAHCSVFLPDGRVATTDLGYDLLRVWNVTPDGLVADHEVVFPQGVGPRHLRLHPSGSLYVVTEFSCEVFALAEDGDGIWQIEGRVPTGAVDGDTGAELAASPDHRFLYAGLRGGSNAIATLRVPDQGGVPTLVGTVDSTIRVPRHHVVVGEHLLIAGQKSDEIVALPLDPETGLPGTPVARVPHPTPQHILPVAE